MSKISTRIKILKECIPECCEIPIKYIDGYEVKRTGKIASCITPKKKDDNNYPFIKIYNTSTDDFYNIAMESDSFETEYIVNMIRQRMSIPEGREAIFYSVFTILHEVGHYLDYISEPDKYSFNFIERDYNEQSKESAIRYRESILEKIADEYALEHIEKTIKNLDTKLFRGMLLS